MLVGEMVSPEEQQAELSPAAAPRSQGGGRRRGRRGGRGRGPRPPVQTERPDQPVGAPGEETAAPRPQPPAAIPAGKDVSAISQAADEVRHIVESLEQALEQMEEVLELVELAERQKSGDEREIDSLRRTLRRIQPPRGHKESTNEPGSD
jgi:hypothetical protein